MLLEVITCGVADAIEAERGGATRLEVIADFSRDGLTPALDLVEGVLAAVRIPARVMLRARDDFSPGGPHELAALCVQARAFAALPIDGVVLGFTSASRLDIGAMRDVLACAPGYRATCHRAIEATADPLAALRALVALPQVDCVLTGGGAGEWRDRARRLDAMQRTVPHLHILVGGGITEDAIDVVCATTRLRAFHIGRSARHPATHAGSVRADRVAAIRQRIERGEAHMPGQ